MKRRQHSNQSVLREEVNTSPGTEGPSAGQSPREDGKTETGGAFSAAAVQWGLSEMPQQRQYRLVTPVPNIPNSPHGKLIPDRQKVQGLVLKPELVLHHPHLWGGVETKMEQCSEHKTDRNLTATHLHPTALRVKEHSGRDSL